MPPATLSVYRRRRLVALAALLGAPGRGGARRRPRERRRAASRAAREPAKAPPPPPQLPRGGREILPRYRVVAYYGAPQDVELGALGIGTPDQAVAQLMRQAKPYAAAAARSCPRSS